MQTDEAGCPWVRELRRNHEGTLVAGDRATPVRFVVDPSTGRVVLPVEGWVMDIGSATLYAPEEREDALQVLLEFNATDSASGASEDRWRAYHGEPRARHWLSATVCGMRKGAAVADEEAVRAANLLGALESKVLRTLNADRSRLAAACERRSKATVSDPCAVGVDEMGVDVRARFGIVRVEFPKVMDAGGTRDVQAVSEWVAKSLWGVEG